MDGSLTVSGKAVSLSGLKLKPASDLGARFKGWLDLNGGVAHCDPAGDRFKCRTANGKDIGLAFAISGFAEPDGTAVDDYIRAAKPLQVRAMVLGDNPSKTLTSVLDGTANITCQNPFGCGARYNFSGFRRNIAAYAMQDWKALIENILSINFKNDINFFYLGRAAEAMGAYSAAYSYYQKAAEIDQSPKLLGKCATITDGAECGGINVQAETKERMDYVQRVAAYAF